MPVAYAKAEIHSCYASEGGALQAKERNSVMCACSSVRIEQRPTKPCVAGSNPARHATLIFSITFGQRVGFEAGERRANSEEKAVSRPG